MMPDNQKPMMDPNKMNMAAMAKKAVKEMRSKKGTKKMVMQARAGY
jgi:hypothetical protein